MPSIRFADALGMSEEGMEKMKGFASIVLAGLAVAALFSGLGLFLRSGSIELQVQGDALAMGAGTGDVAGCAVPAGAASGGNYLLTVTTWQARGVAQGGGYQMLDPGAATLRGSGCCCAYLPLTTRGFP